MNGKKQRNVQREVFILGYVGNEERKKEKNVFFFLHLKRQKKNGRLCAVMYILCVCGSYFSFFFHFGSICVLLSREWCVRSYIEKKKKIKLKKTFHIAFIRSIYTEYRIVNSSLFFLFVIESEYAHFSPTWYWYRWYCGSAVSTVGLCVTDTTLYTSPYHTTPHLTSPHASTFHASPGLSAPLHSSCSIHFSFFSLPFDINYPEFLVPAKRVQKVEQKKK